MQIWIVNPFDPLPGESFRPGRYAFIVNMLSRNGHKVTWWTSNFSHITKQHRYFNPKIDNFRVKLLPTPSYKKNVSLARLYNHYIYGRRFGAEAIKAQERPDVILASIPPLESAAAAIKVGKKLNSKVVIDIQDLWPEVFLLLFPKHFKLLFYRLFQKANSIYKNADGLMGVSRKYIERGLMVCKNSKPAIVLHIGIDLSLFGKQITPDNFPINKEKEDIWITYIGTLGKTHDLDTVLEAASFFLDKPRVKFIIAGNGNEYFRLKKKASKKNIYNVIFTGMLGYCELVHLLNLSDAGLNAYISDAPQTFPNKIFDYFAAGLPVINSIQGELQILLREERAGLQYEAGNPESLAMAIDMIINDRDAREEMGRNGRRLVETRFDRNKEYLKVERFLENLFAKD
jgi:glycosyltransferase involved in cell wall biosynthesis